MKFRNFTPHTVNLNSGEEYLSEGVVRVGVEFTKPDSNGFVQQVFGDVEGLPDQEKDVFIIVSLLVLQASDRIDLVAPASGHPDTIRNDKGHIISVPYFVRGV